MTLMEEKDIAEWVPTGLMAKIAGVSADALYDFVKLGNKPYFSTGKICKNNRPRRILWDRSAVDQIHHDVRNWQAETSLTPSSPSHPKR